MSGWSCPQSQMLELQGSLHPLEVTALLGSSSGLCSAWHGRALSPAGNRQPGWGAQPSLLCRTPGGDMDPTPKKHFLWYPGPHQLDMDHLGASHQ